ncbi:MAG TPA: acyl carrier protein [Acidimicrobiia bacterium]|nr:acyl carrier protein [Acidimicrobiia bacterium]
MTSNDEIEKTIREVLTTHGRMSSDAMTLSADADLALEGMTSHATVNVMLALEEKFDVEFREDMLTRKTFESIASMRDALLELISENPS